MKSCDEILKGISENYGGFKYCDVVNKKGHDALLKDVRHAIAEAFEATKVPRGKITTMEYHLRYNKALNDVAAAQAAFLGNKLMGGE